MAAQAIRTLTALLVALAVLGCDTSGPAPADPAATATAQAADQATISARQQIVRTVTANENVTATAGAAVLARVRPLIQIDLQDAGPIILAGATLEQVRINVTNHDQAAHHLVIRL